jgi:hypothetical protein
MLALPNLLPGPVMPGYSTVFGIPIAVLSARLIGGEHDPRLPAWIARRTLPLERFRRLVVKVAPRLRRIEAVLHPRSSWLTSAIGLRVVGGMLFTSALFLSLPIPFAGWLPAIAIIVLALGLIEKDGTALTAGTILAIASWVVATALIVVGAELLALFARWLA